MDTLNQLNASLGNYLAVMHQNPVLNGVISVAILMYASILAPALPNTIIRLFDTIIGKLIFIFLIAYVSGKNISDALVLSVAFTAPDAGEFSVARCRNIWNSASFVDEQCCVWIEYHYVKSANNLATVERYGCGIGNQEVQGDIDESHSIKSW